MNKPSKTNIRTFVHFNNRTFKCGKYTFVPALLLGYLVANSVFHNRQRENVYWLSREEGVLGVIPCLGSGPRSFCTKFLEHKSSSEDDKDLSGT